MQLNNIIPLIDKLARREQSPEEMEQILLFLRKAKRQDAEAAMERYYAAMEGTDVRADTGDLAYRLEQLITNNPAPVHRVHLLRTTWFRYAAAILLLITGASLYYIFHTPQSQTEVVRNTPPSVPGLDVLPGSDKAILTLSNGQHVQLNNAASETITDGNSAIKNRNGQLVYSAGGSAELLNTMSTPRGGQYKLTLADGTNVWLNAASSITYPIAFTEKTREVSVTGEAYFEVAKNSAKPFLVKTDNGTIIKVTGTKFNINSYENEPVERTSLLEGSVTVTSKTTERKLLPGDQATFRKKDHLLNVAQTNVNASVYWTKGYFYFSKAPLKEVMRQIARWYDIKIEFADNVGDDRQIQGGLSRNIPLSEVLTILKKYEPNFEYAMQNNKMLKIYRSNRYKTH